MKKFITDLYASFSKNAVIGNVLVVGSITILVKAIGFYKETLVASNFGLSIILDTYFIAFLIPGLIQSIFIQSFNSVFIPNYIAEIRTGNNIGPFQTTGFLITGLISIFFMIIAVIFSDIYVEFFFPGHDASYYQLIKRQFYWLAPCVLFWGFSALLAGLLNIKSEFKLSTFQGIFMPISIIICILFFRNILGELTLAISSLIGSFLAFIYLVIVCKRLGVFQLTPQISRNANAVIMLKQVPIKMTSSIFAGLHRIVDQYFAAQLFIGSIAAINYAEKIPAFVLGIVAIALGNVFLPRFSKMVLHNRTKAFSELFRLLKIGFVGGAIIAIIGIISSNFVIRLLFERGEFTGQDTLVVSKIQQIFLIYIPFRIIGVFLVNFLTSINKNSYMAIVSFLSIVINLILNFMLIDSYGVIGIAISSTVAVIFRNVILFFFTLKQYRAPLPS
ncbi:murein biosynthesis integral membrane protein MurJ [Robiginitalea sp. SC105]|uniref:murein biosynthesis integral membrane protein MurJ n=1 Tax=Robiginitalea sp. SC105 TaxID=2762332 RepID=UPI00163AD100|nr:lipid II flippase MurJ [Robiginitalea sp. SC105]MBC2840333.1 polysaccharide biosynthesis C-terminal domain-containing protein [Robiginitalea sp. SC105]